MVIRKNEQYVWFVVSEGRQRDSDEQSGIEKKEFRHANSMPSVRAIGKEIPACSNSGNTEINTCDPSLPAV